MFLQDFEGRTPLHWCTNNPNTKCIEILLDKVGASHDKFSTLNNYCEILKTIIILWPQHLKFLCGSFTIHHL